MTEEEFNKILNRQGDEISTLGAENAQLRSANNILHKEVSKLERLLQNARNERDKLFNPLTK